MRVCLLNALITPFDTDGAEIAAFIAQKIDLARYESILKEAKASGLEVESYLGHESTADFLKDLVSEELKEHFVMNRVNLNLEEGDLALVFRVTNRGPMMKEHSLEDLKAFYEKGETEFVLLSRVAMPEIVLNPSLYFQQVGGEK
jgi:hypothetical protein